MATSFNYNGRNEFLFHGIDVCENCDARFGPRCESLTKKCNEQLFAKNI